MRNFLNKATVLLFFVSFLICNQGYPTEEQRNEMLQQAMQLVWERSMEAKAGMNTMVPQIREELLENLCSSAPNTSFTAHADLADTLANADNTSASIFISIDNQNSWIENSAVGPINGPGYENTWGATTTTNGGNSVDWYLSGSLDSGSLGLAFGQVTVSQSPYNSNNTWPPSDNLYAYLAEDSADDTGSGQDIVNVRGTYSDDKLYASLGLEGSCCNEGGIFGPWYLYVIAIVNPDAANPVAYAYGYGSGGFGQLYPAIYKIDGDLTSGEVSGFEVLSENFNYSTAGNQFQASSLLSIITNDADWGEWPNTLNGIALVGVTVEASLSGLDVAIELLDDASPGILVMSTQSQENNTAPLLLNPIYEDGTLSVTYLDNENNLAIYHNVVIEGDIVFNMIPEAHTYSEGAVFTLDNIDTSGIVTFNFNDGLESISLDFDLGGGDSCPLLGDANGDSALNILDVVLTVNLILNEFSDYEACSDINSDDTLNVLDIVLLVNLILGTSF